MSTDQAVPHDPDSTILERLLAPVGRFLTPEVAREFVDMRATPDVQERIDYLAERANEGELTAKERSEYASYIQGLHLIAILQAKAQAVLGVGR